MSGSLDADEQMRKWWKNKLKPHHKKMAKALYPDDKEAQKAYVREQKRKWGIKKKEDPDDFLCRLIAETKKNAGELEDGHEGREGDTDL